MMIYLDANIVIYLVEDHPSWKPKAAARLGAFRARGDLIATGDASRLECLVVPTSSEIPTHWRRMMPSSRLRMSPSCQSPQPPSSELHCFEPRRKSGRSTRSTWPRHSIMAAV